MAAKKTPAVKAAKDTPPASGTTKSRPTGAKPAKATKKATKKAAAKKSPAKKSTAKKTTAKKTTAKKTAAKKSAAKAAGRKPAAKKPAAKKSAAEKSAAEKSAAKETAAKKAAPRKTTGRKARPGKKAPARTLAVRKGERPWTAGEVADVRAVLEADAGRLRGEIFSVEEEISTLLREGGEGAGHDPADVGSNTFERDHEMSMAKNARDNLVLVDSALARIDDGSYGICESCGNPVGKMRLQAFPRATLCMECKQRQERR
ncbi:MAG: TraR/DksA family transcriptional regulator [Nocardioidaceae bacterium]